MKQTLRKSVYVLLVLSLLLACIPATAGAFPIQLEKPSQLRTETILIPDAMDPDQRIRTIESATQNWSFAPLGEGEYLTDPAAAGAVLREAMEQRQPTATVLYEADASLSFEEVVAPIREAAMAHTGQPTEGDYIAKQRGLIHAQGSYYPGSTTNQYIIDFTIEYYTTAEQETQVDVAVEQLLSSLNLDGKSDYEKLCAVYDWMCANITYDNANLNDDSYNLKYTAYAALIDRTAVCQGYAVLLYRLMLELGIDCRVIAGIGNGGAHAWNIVELGGQYYNLDATWDATWYQGGLAYNFFLRSNATFEDHTRDAEFETEEFGAAYPMSQTDFDPYVDCAHSYTSAVTSPTCTEDGYTTYTCTVCGHSYTETIWATGHLSTHLENQKDATCGAEGYSGDTVCDTCGQIVGYGYTIWPTGDHNYDSQVTTEAGCETNGVMTYTCTVCGHSYTETIWATGHYYDPVVTDPTCIEQGYTTYTCAYCGDVYVDSYTGALGHNYSCAETLPTCTEDGSRTYTCHCGDTYTEVIPAIGHSYTYWDTAPTCTEEGYTTYNCVNCGDTYTDNYVDALGHSCYESVIPPSCTEQGYTYYGCTVCGYSYEDNYVDALGHSYSESVIPPTCTDQGWTYYTCTVCGDTYQDNFVEAYGHSYTDEVVAPTCTREGYTLHKCSTCGHECKDNYVDALGHSWGEGVVTAPTCTEQGYTTYFCTAESCGIGYAGDYVEAKGHSYVPYVTPPTCTRQGYTSYYCSECDYYYQDNYTEPKGHEVEYGSCIYCYAPFEGYCGDDLTWVLSEDMVLTISGTGDMWDFGYIDYGDGIYSHLDAPWQWASESIRTVVIEEGVTSIGKEAFYYCTSLTSITIPSTITRIGDGAFTWCDNVNRVYISDMTAWCAMESGYVGGENTELYLNGKLVTELVIPDGVTSIGDGAFYGFDSLLSVTVPDSVTSIGDSAFRDCDGLTDIKIPNGVTSIGISAFSDCDSLTSVAIPDSVTSIDLDAFISCPSLVFNRYDDAYYLGNEENPYFALIYGSNYASCTIHADTKVIAGYAFRDCRELRSITISDSVTHIGEWVFYGCTNLTNVTIGESVISIGYGAFSGCTSLTDITIPDSVTSIGDEAFWYCESLTDVTIGSGMTSIGGSAFGGCTSLTDITIPDSVTSIGYGAFSGCTSLTDITIPDSVTSIGEYAFYYCTSLTDITIPDSVTSIGEYAFSGCASLASITIPDNVSSIGNEAFSNCESLTDVTIGNGATSIGNSAFRYCSNLTNVTIGEGVISIGGSAFEECTSLTEITIPGSVTSIGGGAFYGCTNLNSVVIGSGVTCISSSVFEDCTNLTVITIPATVTSIKASAFDNCISLWHVLYQGTETQWNAIDIHWYYNEDLTDAVRHYNCTGEEVTDALNHVCQICGPGDMPDCGHIWDEGAVTLEPGCETVGHMTYNCTKCGETHIEEIAATGHYPITVGNERAPTCGSDGYTGDLVCDICGKIIEYGVVIEATGTHEYTSQVDVEPTCSEQGVMTYTCVHCGYSYTEAIPTVPHNFVNGACADCGAAEVQLGDVNRDGRVNARDARLLLRYLAGLADESEIDLAAADFNGDGKVNARDARAILRSIAGLG